MATSIKIKRSATSGNPAILGSGELAYSSLPDNGTNGGDRLYVGTGTETNGDAANHVVIGGKYFTDKLDHSPGTLTHSSAIIVDVNKKIDDLLVDDIQINGATISTTSTNGNLILAPNGVGKVNIANAYTIPRADGTVGQVLTTDGLGNVSFQSPSASSFTIAGNTGTDQFNTGEQLTITGTAPVSTIVTDNTVTISVADATTTAKGIARFSATNFDVSSGVVSIKAGGVPNASLANSSVTLGTTAIALGASATTIAGLVSVTSASFVGALTGNASTATALATSRTIGISGPVTGTATSFDGSTDITIPVSSVDMSHANITGILPVTKGGTGATTSTGTSSVVLSNSPALTGIPTAPTASAGTNTSQIATTEFVATAVDNARTGLDVKESVRAATTAPITLSNTQTIDGVALAVGNRVLVKDQATASQNGIYIVDSGAWTRALDANTDAKVNPGLFVFVEQGTVNSDSGWILTTDAPITLDNTSLTFAQFSGAGQITAGNGLTKTGNTLNVGAGTGIVVSADDVALTGQALALHNLATSGIIVRTGAGSVASRTLTGTTNRITVTNGDGITDNPTVDISSTYVGQSSITTVGTIGTGLWNGTTIGTAYGGTGLNNYAAGDLLYASATNLLSKLTLGADGKVLQSNGVTLVYADIDGGTYG
jgi:hypothetical protein